jgi:hypothetical protein
LHAVGDRETEPRAHSLRVAPDRVIEFIDQTRLRAKLGKVPSGLAPRQPREHPEEDAVLATREPPHQARVDGEQRRHASPDVDPAPVGGQYAREGPEQRRLPGAARPHQRDSLTCIDAQAHVAQSPGIRTASS